MKKSTLLPMVMAGLGCLLASQALAQFITQTNDGTITITGYYGPGGAVTIPSTINGLPVTSIGDYAFSYGEFAFGSPLTSVNIPNGVTSIGDNAFSSNALTSVTIPDSVTNIGDYAFYDCSSLANLTIGNSVTSIGDYAFSDTALTSVTIPGSVTNIGDYAFEDGLRAGTMMAIMVASNNPTYSGVAGILFDKNQTTIIQYPDGNGASSYTIPNTVTSIGDGAFFSCILASITTPNSITNIGDYAFYECALLTNAPIGTNVTRIGDYAFAGSDNDSGDWRLTSVTIPNSVTSIGNYAFFNDTLGFDDTGMTNLTIGSGVTNIGEGAFGGCFSLIAITVASNNPAYSSVAGVLFDKSQTTLIQFAPGGFSEAPYSYTIPNSVTSIGDYAFDSCFVSSVTIPDSVTNIGDYAFYGTGLTSVTIPDSVLNIGDYGFAYIYGLTNVTIGNGVTTIGDYAFFGCQNLTSVVIGTGVTSIGNNAFVGDYAMTGVYFEGNAPSADVDTFEPGLTTCYYVAGTSGWEYFADSTGLTVAVWPFGVQYTAAPANVPIGYTIQFECPDFDVDGNTIINWNWDFGDGTTSTNQNPEHVYTFAGSYIPSLLAVNDLGTPLPGSGPSITVSPPPALTGIHLSGNNLAITGANGFMGISYYVLTSTNLALPRSQWTSVATNIWSANGNFSVNLTNAFDDAVPRQFYLLQLQ